MFTVEPHADGSGSGIYHGTRLVADITADPLTLANTIADYTNTLARRQLGRDLLALTRQLQTITLQSLPEMRASFTQAAQAHEAI